MNKFFYILVFLTVFSSCSEYQKALKSEDIAVKFALGEQLYKDGKYSKASRLFDQIVPAYRGKPQAEKLMFLDADSYFHMGLNAQAGFRFERFAKSYSKSDKVEEAYYKSALSYADLSPVFSKEQHETNHALEKLQLFKPKEFITYLGQWDSEVKMKNYLEKKYPNFLFIGLTSSYQEREWKNQIKIKKLNKDNQYRIDKGIDWLDINFPRAILIDKNGKVQNNMTHLANRSFEKQLKKLQ